MFFTNWINWIISFFVIQNNSHDDQIPTKTVHRTEHEIIQTPNCQGVSAKAEINKSNNELIQKTNCQGVSAKAEIHKSNNELIQKTNCQGVSAKAESIEEMDKEIKKNMENMKFKNVLEKIRKYHILDDGDFQYIKLLPNDQMMKFIRNLQ